MVGDRVQWHKFQGRMERRRDPDREGGREHLSAAGRSIAPFENDMAIVRDLPGWSRHTDQQVTMPEEHFREEAIRRAQASGYFPALGQREVDWDCVEEWRNRVQQPGFVWLPENELDGCGFIIIGSNLAIASGQHRILGGLMGDNPVPKGSISMLTCPLPTQPWR